MSWIIDNKQVTGEIQYISGNWDAVVADNARTDSLEIPGYLSIDLSFEAQTAGGPVDLEGSLDGTNFFLISTITTITTSPPINSIKGTIPVKFVRLFNNSGGGMRNISFSAET